MAEKSLVAKRRQIEALWASFMAGTRSPQTEITSSWQRSSHALSPERSTAPVDDPEQTLREWYSSILYMAAKPVLADIEKAATDQDFIVAVSDAHGKLLWTSSSGHMKKRAERLHFVPGSRWDEASIGTNALDLAIRSARPVAVFSAEHFVQAAHDWVCYSAPIRDPRTERVLGVLDFSSTWRKANPFGLATVTAFARCIEERLGRLLPSEPSATSIDLLATDLLAEADEPLRLRLCDRPEVLFRAERLDLPLRRLEIVALLALHPQGLSLDALHAHLYGDRDVSVTTLKAEVSLLRKQLGGQVGSRPYRLAVPVFVDALAVDAALRAGDVERALRGYRAPLLPSSESPTLREWRDYLDRAVRDALIRSGRDDLMWRYVTDEHHDFEVMLTLMGLLADDDPRLPLLKGRLKGVGLEPPT